MLLSWLFVALSVLFLVGLILATHFDKEVLTALCTVMFIVSMSVMTGILIEETSKPDVEGLIHKYSILLKEINEYDDDTDFELKYNLFTECERFDNIIIKHDKLHDSMWRGRGYSEEIGELPLLSELFIDKFN